MLNSNQILSNAKKITGLSSLGNPLFIEGFETLIKSINEEADLNEIGIQAQQHRLTGLLTNLLLIDEAIKKNNEILKEKIISPVVIVGLPRTGSTMTHRLLAADPNHTAMLWWEGRNPAMLKNEIRGNPEERMALGKAEVDAVVAASPDALKIHPWDYKGADYKVSLKHILFN